MVARRVFMAIIAAAMISSVCGQACSTYTTCDTCLGQVNTATSPNSVCGWCVTSTTAYCSSSSSGCVSYEDYKVNGVAGSTVAVTANDTALEAYPQEFNVYLRKHEPVSLTISVKSQGCKKLDLYYLMDLSQSMLNDKNTLESLATDLSNKATELCEAGCPGGAPADCVSLGFGSFIDKPISPFGYWTQTTNEALTGPLPGLPFFETSSPAWDYVWRNSAPLLAANSGGTDAFRLGVSNSETRENIDQPESGLEALLQVAACDTEVGWRSDARRIVFYASDADFHIAGDGARAGIYAKNDGTCYVTSPSGTDTVKNREIDAASIRQDYPSISQLSQSLIGSNIVPIFAYKETTLLAEAKNSLVYPNLVTQLGFGFHGQLAESSGNVVALLESAYASISTTIRLETQRNGNEALVSSISPSQFTNIATDVVYSFTVTLEYDGTTAYGTNLPVVFTPLGFNQVTVHVTTQPDATCSCASNSDYCPALHCGNSGSCECGKCTCPTGSSGDNCECSNDVTPCRQGQTTCGGRGVCECGVCVCDAGFTGQFCDCSTASCPTSLTALGDCSGNGICECGTCNCTNGYTGFDCSCPPNDPSQQCNATICGNFGASTGFCATASGQCNTQQCECVSGWQIDSNGACSCQLLPCPLGPNDQPCNSQGTCGCGGLCQCNAGWTSTAANAADGSCDCDSTAVCPSDENGLECGGIGTCNCGTCECPQEYELPANSEDPSYACTCLNTECPSSATAECSGHGNCTCGVCVCEAGFAGSDCSQPCNVGGSCPVDSVSGLDCGGASQGTCNTECSYCVCERDWTGAACNCSEAQCLSVTAGECSDHGSCVCGACECDAGYGNAAEGCRCDLSTPCPTTALGACDGSLHGRCIVGDYDSDGRFQCGSCECLTGWSGTFCNCSTASCPVDSDGIECGPQGTCNGCGECECNSGWSLSESEVCDCEDNALCGGVITVNGTQVDCNGRGSCQCGISCECVKPYSGSNCELCDSDLAATLNTTCPNDVCSSILSCETCAQNSLCGYCVTLGACYTLTEIGSVCAGGTTALSGSETSNCVTTGKSLSQEAKVGIAAGVAGAIIGIGLLCIVIFKLAQVAADKREWKEWEKQRGRAAWSSNGNPLFQPNTKEFDNPLFQSKTQKASRKSSLYHSQSPTAPEAVEQSDL